MRDHTYDHVPWRPSEIEHRYGANVHILADPFYLGLLARLCAKGTIQPEINRLVVALYEHLVRVILNGELPRKQVSVPTRMIEHTPRGMFHGEVVDPESRVVTVNIARAGTLPSQVAFDLLNTVIDPRLVRQDHMVMNRTTDAEGKVTGVSVTGSKIGGDVDDAVVLFPDPMGATGGSLSTALRIYKDEVPGSCRKLVAANLIVTPEYLRRMTADHPDAVIYAMRLDRGMSPPEIFDTVPGERWDDERGLDDKQYIVPGGGGFGELMNNAFV
jgi:uracil phosphoribosyltransferase